MPKSDTWPGGVAMDSLSNMDSAGSCDSVISMNSCRSEDSMEHLSPEERACLMYLEETIEALEVQEDSGLSNDESDIGLQAVTTEEPKVDDISSFKSDEFGRAEPHPLNQTSEPQSFPVSAADTKDLISTSQSVIVTQPEPPDTDSSHPPPAPQTQVPSVSTGGDDKPQIVRSSELCPDDSAKASEIDLDLIPPPSDFMDVPLPPAQTKTVPDHPPPAGTSQYKPGPAIDLDMIRQRASLKKTLASPQEAPKTPEVPPPLSPPPITFDHQLLSPPAEAAAEPKSPPAVAPKPKKLPPNIILKSHKASDGNVQQSAPASSDRALLDPQRVRMEALRKLGLLKSNEADSGPALSPLLSPKTRRSWGAPHSPASSPTPQTPPLTPSSTFVDSPPPTFVPPQPSVASSSSSSVSTAPDILPAPAAFSDSVGPLPSDNEPFALQDASEAKVKAQMNTPPLTPPTLAKKLTPPKFMGVKSATLERSGLGLSNFMASETDNGVGNKLSLGQLRNNRPRPASLGSRKEFSEDLQPGRAKTQEANSRRSTLAHNTFQHSGDSSKLPRAQGISVLICPRAENGEDRREALKKLGLLRD